MNKQDNIVGRLLGAIGYVAQAVTERERGDFEGSIHSVNHAVEILLLGEIRIPSRIVQRANENTRIYEAALREFRILHMQGSEDMSDADWAKFDGFYEDYKCCIDRGVEHG